MNGICSNIPSQYCLPKWKSASKLIPIHKVPMLKKSYKYQRRHYENKEEVAASWINQSYLKLTHKHIVYKRVQERGPQHYPDLQHIFTFTSRYKSESMFSSRCPVAILPPFSQAESSILTCTDRITATSMQNK